MKAQSSSARCRVGAIDWAKCALARSRLTTTSCPSRLPSFKVASFISGYLCMPHQTASQDSKGG